jgi:hypothetical protein
MPGIVAVENGDGEEERERVWDIFCVLMPCCVVGGYVFCYPRISCHAFDANIRREGGCGCWCR